MLAIALFVLAVPLDKPVRVEKIPVTAHIALTTGQVVDDAATLTCTYYRDFVVKQVDNPNDKGADRLTFARFLPEQPACSLETVGNEVIVSNALVGAPLVSGEAAGFGGALGDWAIFDGDDGIGNGTPFAIYDTLTGKKVFQDMRAGALDVGPGVVRYRRLLQPGCSAMLDAACRKTIARELEIKRDVLTLCKPAYAKSKMTPDAASAIAVEGALDRRTLVYTVKPNGQAECWPSP